MPVTQADVRQFIEDFIRPKVRVDGGDIQFVALDADEVVLDAHADCAYCPAASECLKWWIEKELSARFGGTLRVRIHHQAPYFKR